MLRVRNFIRWRAGCMGPAVAVLCLAPAMGFAEAATDAALARIAATCPTHYPAAVLPVPDTESLARRSDADLLELAGHWNPIVRTRVAYELATRGESVLPALREMTRADDDSVRAGGTTALARWLQHRLKNAPAFVPGEADADLARATLQKRHRELAEDFARLADDPHRNVREPARGGLSMLADEVPAALDALLAMCVDPDAHIAQAAIIALEKQFAEQALARASITNVLHAAMHSPLPRGRGHVVRLIARMPPDAQRAMIPDLLHHLDWQPDRDTMFGAGGQELALHILTEHRVEALVPRLPHLMNKTMRGPGLFAPALASAKAFGSAAKPILPALRTQMQALQEQLDGGAGGRRAEDLRAKRAAIEDVVNHVETH